MKKISRGTVLTTGAVLGVLTVGIVSGSAIAGSALTSPADNTRAPSYETNSSGLTYGSALKAVSPDSEPNLILVTATNGREGFVYKAELDQASGNIDFKSPDEALAWQKEHSGPTSVTVYDQDGKTVIGEFTIGQRK